MAANRLSLAVSVKNLIGGTGGCSHLISKPAAPLNHLGYSGFVHALARLLDSINDREISLQCVEGSNSVL